MTKLLSMRVPLEIPNTLAAVGWTFFGPLGARTEEVIDQFDDDEFEVIERFLTGAAESMREHLDHLRAQEATESGTLPEDA